MEIITDVITSNLVKFGIFGQLKATKEITPIPISRAPIVSMTVISFKGDFEAAGAASLGQIYRFFMLSFWLSFIMPQLHQRSN